MFQTLYYQQNRQVDRLDMNDSDDENLLGDLVEHNARQRKHKIVVWSVEETRQFYDVSFVPYLLRSVFVVLERTSS